MINDLSGKVAIVTGAGGTLCSAMAKDLAAQGVQVALLGRDVSKLKLVEVDIMNAGGTAISVSVDVTDEQSLLNAEKYISEAFGDYHILINGAGGNQTAAVTNINNFDVRELTNTPDLRGFFNLDMGLFADVILTNSMGTILPCNIFGRKMAAAGKGNIINMASMSSYRALSRVGAYAFAKAGIVSFTQWLGAYLAPTGVRVNAIAPGFFLNERSKKLLTTDDGGFTERGSAIINLTPMKKLGEASQLLGTMNFLLNDQASGFVTGITIPVDGGFLSSAGI